MERQEDNERPEEQNRPADDDVIEIDLDDDDAGASSANDDILVVELEPDEPGAAASGAAPNDQSAGDQPPKLPPVTTDVVAAATALEVPAICALTHHPFVLTVLPRSDGYDVLQARPATAADKTALATKPAGTTTLRGIFHLTGYDGCPFCKAAGLILCDVCGTVSCTAQDPKTGQLLPCPVCGNAGPVETSKNGWTVKARGGKGKKKGGKGPL